VQPEISDVIIVAKETDEKMSFVRFMALTSLFKINRRGLTYLDYCSVLSRARE
jgi:hypothetical protein